jgi:diguanylate cyclase (GGDEF)-like protein
MKGDSETVSIETPVDLYEGIITAPPALVVVYGSHLGKAFYLQQADQTIGRDASCDIHLEDDSVSRRHARISVAPAATRVRDLDSTNGLFVNGHRVREGELQDGDRLHLGETVLKYISGRSAESKFHEDVYRLMTVDDLTQAFNRQYFFESLKREISRAQRYRRRLSVAMLDIDRFKAINDTYGHPAGDAVLKTFAALVTDNIRQSDLLARYGGDEFALLLPEIDPASARKVCEKLCTLVADHPFEVDGQDVAVTTSIGLQSYAHSAGEASPGQLMAAVDARLYEAKQAGRNQISCGGL